MEDFAENAASDEYHLWNSIFDKISTSLQCPHDDFIPKDYQSELANSMKSSNKILYLPCNEDKLYTLHQSYNLEVQLFRPRKVSCTLQNWLNSDKFRLHFRARKHVIYLIDPSKYVSTVADFFKRHSYYPVIAIEQNKEEKLWNRSETTGILVSTGGVYLSALTKGNIKLKEAEIIFFDDCAYTYGQNSMKQVMNLFSNCNEQDWPRIVAYTSCLLHPKIKADDNNMFEFLKNLEITFKSTIISSQYCNLTRKLLPRVSVKFVKFRELNESFEDSPYKALCLDTLIGKVIANFEGLKLPVDLKNFILKIFQDITRYMYLYGMYLPAFVVSNIHRMTLEKVLLCRNSTTFILSAITSDLYVIRSLIWDKLVDGKSESQENATTIVKNSSEKIIKLLSLLYKLEYDGNCIIFVNDCTTAKLIAFILQKLSKCETKMLHIAADFIASDQSILKSENDHEQAFFKKQLDSVVQKFHKCLLNVLVISWKTDFNIDDLSSDWIIYFDLAPTYSSYVLSRKFANDTNNSNYFFIEETDNENKFNNDKNSLGEFVNLDLNLKELISVKDLNNEYRLRKSLKKFEETKLELESKFPPLITEHNKRVS